MAELLTREDRKVLFYLACTKCGHKFASVNKAKPCTLCLGLARPYGFKELHASPES